ncbi:MAG: hypothetical protein V4609_17505 [Pseudomonadota bacterium]
MLPRGSQKSPSPFTSYAQAQAALEMVVPFQTPTSQLKSLGFDPEGGSNVTRIPYPEVVARLVPYSGVPLDALDAGIRECILARSACQAYLFHFDQHDRRREGGFWADFFNVRRQTHVTGWSMDALVVVTDGKVLFRNHGGQPQIDRTERQVNPLGPLQPAGEAAGAALVR